MTGENWWWYQHTSMRSIAYINTRGRKLLKHPIRTDLEISSWRSEPQFQTSTWQKVLDITLCSRGIMDEVSGWIVLKEPLLSDRKHIIFNLDSAYGEKKFIRTRRGQIETPLEMNYRKECKAALCISNKNGDSLVS